MDSLQQETSSYVVHGSKFECAKRYSIIEPVGQGAYGIVCSASDEESGEQIAIKKIENAFEHIAFTKRTLRELRILRHLRHENLLDIRSMFLPGRRDSFDDVYVVSELMETDLATILKSPQPLTEEHCQFFLYQILRGMKYVHSGEVIHRDLKPRNMLVNANCDLKICDFGLARVSFPEREFQTCPMTEYVCTRWYRAPEVLCCWSEYTSAVDVWSIGCIFAEMLVRRALFPGQNTQHQLRLIVECLGAPATEELQQIPNQKCRRYIESLPTEEAAKFNTYFGDVSAEAKELLRKTICFGAQQRVSVQEALRQEYLSALFCPDDEPTRAPLDTTDFEFERRKINFKALREELFIEAMCYYPENIERFKAEQAELAASGQAIGALQCRLLRPGEAQYSSDEEDGEA